MASPKKRMSELMGRVRKGNLRTSQQIVQETLDRLGLKPGAVTSQQVMAGFNDYLRSVWQETLVTLEGYEEKAYASGIPQEFMREFPNEFESAEQAARSSGFHSGFQRLFSDLYPWFRQAFLSISQSRKTRGGKDFELQIEGLFRLGNVPFHKQESTYRTDLILPNLKVHEQNRTRSMVVSVKRTLRERWAEVAEELFNLRSPNVYLFTADENVSEGHVERICGRYNIYLVVWDAEVKTEKYPNESMVLGYTQWATEHLARLRSWW